MTRDIKTHYEPDPATEDEVYAALWATSPFPSLPSDAPEALKEYTIDIVDPKRVYTIHQAARRHHFQLLVERCARYLFQIRYGCTSEHCNTSTCFSSRKRSAGGAPVRRYNGTSARTLAVYMASQDNPEQGLCQYPSAGQHLTKKTKIPSKPRRKANGSVDLPTSTGDVASNSKEASTKKPHPLGSNKTNPMAKDGTSEKLDTKSSQASLVATLNRPATIDHRSFIQNVMGATAFKMLNWLTPKTLEILSRPPETTEPVEKDAPKDLPQHPLDQQSAAKEKEPETPSAEDLKINGKIANEPQAMKTESEPPSLKASNKSSKTSPVLLPTSSPAPKRNSSSSSHRKRSDSAGSSPPKGILNIPSRASGPSNDTTLPQFRPSNHKQKISRQPSITSPQLQVAELSSMKAEKPTVKIIAALRQNRPLFKNDENAKQDPISRPKPKVERAPKKTESSELPSPDIPPFAQSVLFLPIDLLLFLCGVMKLDGTAEKHDLRPSAIEQEKGPTLNRQPQEPALHGRELAEHKEKWRIFVEQSFFDVLSKPDSLLNSFTTPKFELFDTLTLWYLLFRMTRVAPSVVFHSLWIAAGALYNLPEDLETVHDWAKPPESNESGKPLSNQEAGNLMSVCLHALIAAAPLTRIARQLANMSRIRSYGVTMLGRDQSSLEPTALCLAYEDVFTNELIVRLARRVFASIPTRRRFTELLDVQNDAQNDGDREPDVLEAVLGKLRFLDLEQTPLMNFELEERDLHEKRVPTLLLDWARTVMLQDWQGSAEVPAEGAFGGALALIAAVYKHRKSLLLGDIHFRTEYFAERLDPVTMPLEWLQFEPNKRTAHLLDFPYLFNPATLVTYFRSINYSRMNQAYELARATSGLMRSLDPHFKLMPDSSSRYRLWDRISTGTTCFMVLEISRQNVLEDTFNAIWRREEREIMRPLKIRLGEEGGEEGLDSGGVQQEFFRLAIAAALDPDYGTFTIDSRTKMTWFQPGSPEPLWKFELIGLIISLAIYNGLTLPVTFPKALYQKLLNEEVSELHHIADGWPDLANGLTTLLEWDEKDGLVEDIFARTYEFSVSQFGQPISVEMTNNNTPHWPQFADAHSSLNPVDAPLVTNANRNSYVSDYIRFLTDVSIRPQFDAFRKGFLTCLDPRSLSLFTASTLQSLLEGVQEIDIAELRRCTRYIGWDATHRTVRDFWSVVKKFDHEQKKKLLEFVTASDRVPVGGMRNLQFTLQRNGVEDGHLPSSYTCYGIMLMPEYSGKEVLREKLGMALENSRGFGFA